MRTLQDKYIVFSANKSIFFSQKYSHLFFAFLLILPSYIVAAFLSLDFCQLDLSSLLGPTVFVINHLAFQQLPYLQGFSLALLKVTEGQSEPFILNTKM